MFDTAKSSHRLGRWLESFYLSDDPFALSVADQEHDCLPSFFVDRPYLHNIFGNPSSPQLAILLSNRGEGKTATREMVAYNCLKSKMGRSCLPVHYTDFSYLLSKAENLEQISSKHHVVAIIRRIIYELVNLDHTPCFDLLSDFDASILGGFAKAYADPVTLLRLRQMLQVEPASLESDNMTASELLSTIVDLIVKMGPTPQSRYQSVYVLIDRIDETDRGPEAATTILRSLVSDGPLLNLKNLALKFFLTYDVGRHLASLMAIPAEKYRIEEIEWDKESLREIVNLRLSYYSRGRITHLEQVCATSVKYSIFDRLYESSDRSPRTLLRLCRMLIDARANRTDATSNLIERNDLVDALTRLGRERELVSGQLAITQLATIDSNNQKRDTNAIIAPTGLFLDRLGHVYLDGKKLNLSLPEMEYRLLETLYKVSPKVMSEIELVDILWPKGDYDRQRGQRTDSKRARDNLRKLIARLRSDLAGASQCEKDRFIKNERSRGYWLSTS